MKKKIMVLCDSEEAYARHMTDYLKKKKELPFELHTYTEREKLLSFGREHEIELLVVSETDYTYEVSRLPAGQVLILNETGTVRGEGITNINKYQKAEKVYKQIMESCLACVEEEGPSLKGNTETKLIGLYSPVRRCLQTSFGLTLGQMLSEKHKTLYISLEHYAGWQGMYEKEGKPDLADLLYYAEENGERFYYKLKIMEEKIGNLSYIPPAFTGQNLIYVEGRKWLELLARIEEQGEYEFIILDISDSIQGVFELLRMCDRIYTITREDRLARAKIDQYEQLLQLYEYADVLQKTCRQALPYFKNLPEQMEQFTKGDLAEYVRRLILDDLEAA